MKDRVIVYGLGKRFFTYRDLIERKYNIIGYCDMDEDKVEHFPTGIARKKLEEISVDAYDRILIMPANAIDIAWDLVNNLNIPGNKIEVFVAEDRGGAVNPEFPVYTFHGGCNDDAILTLLMHQLNIRISDIKYLEIGTNHPVHGNQTYLFYRRGARGVLVEPLLQKFELPIRLFRPEDRVLFTAVTGHALHKTTTFYEAENLYRSSLYEQHHPEGMNVREVTVNLIGINELMNQIGFVPDLLVVDAEGEDENILRNIDYGRFSPKIIMAEIVSEDFIRFMQRNGYIWYCTVSGVNTIYYRRDLEINAD